MAADDNIDMWRTRVPSRLDREDPFEGDGFESRPATRLTFREPDPPVHRPSTRLSFLRSATPLFRRSSSRSQRPPSPYVARQPAPEKSGLLGLFSRKRKREPSPEPESIPVPRYQMNFLFVGAHGSGQTSLLFRARYGYFPDVSHLAFLKVQALISSQTRAFSRPLYETYSISRNFEDRIDTSGTPDLNTVERCAFMKFDAIFLCFDISDKVSLYTIEQWWQHASSNGFGPQGGYDPPVFLLGLKKDLRDQCFLEDHRNGRNRNVPGVLANPPCCVMPGEAMFHADRLGHVKYLECSAATGEGMEAVLDEAVREAWDQRDWQELFSDTDEDETQIQNRREICRQMRKANTGLRQFFPSIMAM
ncbi:P-loop containing nucleoside triphosphate hydrolase protein [Dactylonectria macrodidyma]|uniref:P-loop containing nucleoside triphosphate hydrolase protein n=1 Tax=Dactylonectria macrodidyma TaxID=307937 RepID=A0A9P9F6L4_9HYPO|nr:P-loop containing nucleoside triphosphate hydrolase protein [Dactylonectria macrodidyma]